MEQSIPSWALLLEYTDFELIKNKQSCQICQKECYLTIPREKTKPSDLYWRCSTCRNKKSIFSGSIFYGKSISLEQFHILCHLFVRKIKAAQGNFFIKALAGSTLALSTIYEYYQYFRNTFSQYLRLYMPLISLPGPVEIDECKIGARVPVPDRSQDTLLPILVSHVDSGSEVISDQFAFYVSRQERSHLEELGFEHYFVNHSLGFVDPIQEFIHTNGIERVWRSLKASISQVKLSISAERIDSFLDTFIFENYFTQDSLYDVLLQILLTLENRNQ